MKNRYLLLAFLLMLVFNSNRVVAQMDNLANMSAEWIRMNNRNAALDAADIVNYNPAGLVYLKPGLHFNLSNQTLFRHPKHSYDLGLGDGPQSFEQDGLDAFLPMFYAAFVKGNWAIGSGVYISGGGATVDYPDGSISTDLMTKQIVYQQTGMLPSMLYDSNEQSLKASSYYLTVPLLFSYKINRVFSASFGARYIRGINNTQASLFLSDSPISAPDIALGIDYDASANGVGAVLGVNIAPSERLNIAAHYESRVKLDFENDVKVDDTGLFTDGAKNRRDLPAALSTGISYRISERLRTEVNYNYYFQTDADWGTTSYASTDEVIEAETSELAGNCYTLGAGFAYDMSEKTQLSLGCSYTHFGYDNDEDKALYYTNMGWYEALKNSNLNIGFGGAYKVRENLSVNMGFGITLWKDYDINSKNAELLGVSGDNAVVKCEDRGYVFSIGVNYSL